MLADASCPKFREEDSARGRGWPAFLAQVFLKKCNHSKVDRNGLQGKVQFCKEFAKRRGVSQRIEAGFARKDHDGPIFLLVALLQVLQRGVVCLKGNFDHRLIVGWGRILTWRAAGEQAEFCRLRPGDPPLPDNRPFP